MIEPNVPILPKNAELQYLGEGAANIVYRISIPQHESGTPLPSQLEEYGEGTPPPSEIEFFEGGEGDCGVFENKLLRVRKELPTTLPCAIAQSSWESLVAPLFTPTYLVTQSLVSLRPGPHNHIHALNTSLKALENNPSTSISVSTTSQEAGVRPSKRRGVYLADDEYGLLVTDMSGPDVLQFKPKWLAQSPSAPEGAIRCRQCALVARKAAVTRSQAAAAKSEGREAQVSERGGFCPLDLLSENSEDVERVADAIVGPSASPGTVSQFARWVSETDLLRMLRDVQLRMDRRGVLVARANDEDGNRDLRVAMTVRDCSVFVRLPELCLEGGEAGEGKVEARIGDLDVKSPDKLAYWQETERALVEEGWYAGSETVQWERQNTCSLGRR
ncbi:inositol-pentakisphosphate 2-kinase [Rhexocercosporidium sp. MPI-PUGE-AT-0058]|nr:inositol-pentakisphosphate 2-kinase [Rhexocercosporidium sp. MPI-PUGE-AT-0058]